MSKFAILDSLLRDNNGFLKTSAATGAGVSRTTLGEYVRTRGLERVAHGLYMARDAWEDGLYVIQTRYPEAVFSHETALYLLNIGNREPLRYTLTLKTGTNSTALARQGVKVYKIRESLFGVGVTAARSQAGNPLRVYDAERTICDLFRSRRNVEIQDLQTAVREYLHRREKNIPLLMRYAKSFAVEKIVRQYLEALL
jgi:hypothetical protein